MLHRPASAIAMIGILSALTLSCTGEEGQCYCDTARTAMSAGDSENPAIIWDGAQTLCRVVREQNGADVYVTESTSPYVITDATPSLYEISDIEHPSCRTRISLDGEPTTSAATEATTATLWIREALDLLDVTFSQDRSLLSGFVAGTSDYQIARTTDGTDIAELSLLNTTLRPRWIGRNSTLALPLTGQVWLFELPDDVTPIGISAPINYQTDAVAWPPSGRDFLAAAESTQITVHHLVNAEALTSVAFAASSDTATSIRWIPGWLLVATEKGFLYTLDDRTLDIDERLGPYPIPFRIRTCADPRNLWIETSGYVVELSVPGWHELQRTSTGAVGACSGAIAVADSNGADMIQITLQSGAQLQSTVPANIAPILNLYWNTGGDLLFVRGSGGSMLMKVTQ